MFYTIHHLHKGLYKLYSLLSPNQIKVNGLAQADLILQKIIETNTNLDQISQGFANQETESTAAIIEKIQE